MGAHQDPVWVQIVTTQRVVELGLGAMLQAAEIPFTITTSGPPDAEPDVVLFDVIAMHDGHLTDLDTWVQDTVTTVIAIDRTLRPDLGAQARTHGVEWSITLGINEHDLGQVIQEAIAGTLEDSTVVHEWEPAAYLGHELGLSRRESEVLTLVARGHSNQDIAAQLFLSINSVKTYIRSTYRKIDVSSRSQAVAWAIQAGFPIDPPVTPVAEPVA